MRGVDIFEHLTKAFVTSPFGALTMAILTLSAASGATPAAAQDEMADVTSLGLGGEARDPDLALHDNDDLGHAAIGSHVAQDAQLIAPRLALPGTRANFPIESERPGRLTMSYEWCFDFDMRRGADGVWRPMEEPTLSPILFWAGPAVLGASMIAASFLTGLTLGLALGVRRHEPAQPGRSRPRTVHSHPDHFSPG